MNDRYLFRVKRIDNGEWTYGYLYGIWERKYILWGMTNDVPNMEEVDPSTICQCTGLKDKNGKLIWENDIITICAYDYLEPTNDYTGIVCYFEKDACWCLRDFDEKDKIIPICECYGDYTTEIFKLGNIFDNPELLEQEG